MELRLDVMNKTFWLCKMLLLQFKSNQECKSVQPQVRYKPVAFIAVLEKTATKCFNPSSLKIERKTLE